MEKCFQLKIKGNAYVQGVQAAMPKNSVACIVTWTTAHGTYRLEDTESRHDTIFKINHTDGQLIYPSTGFLIQLTEGEHRHQKKKKTMGHLTSQSTKYFAALHERRERPYP